MRRTRRRAQLRLVLAVLGAVLGISGCAMRQKLDNMAQEDPLEPVNRVFYKVNDLGDRYVLRPVAKGYVRVTPRVFRLGATHFFDNLGYPVVVVNDFLQGKGRQGSADAARLLLNSTIGLLGILDPATDIGLAQHDEDFGQTLAVWGMPAGPFLMVPLVGPRTTTHALGSLGDNLVSPLHIYSDASVRSKLVVFQTIHRRSTFLQVDDEIRQSFDPYVFIRDAYLQNRNYLIHDGKVPEEELLPADEDTDAGQETGKEAGGTRQ